MVGQTFGSSGYLRIKEKISETVVQLLINTYLLFSCSAGQTMHLDGFQDATS